MGNVDVQLSFATSGWGDVGHMCMWNNVSILWSQSRTPKESGKSVGGRGVWFCTNSWILSAVGLTGLQTIPNARNCCVSLEPGSLQVIGLPIGEQPASAGSWWISVSLPRPSHSKGSLRFWDLTKAGSTPRQTAISCQPLFHSKGVRLKHWRRRSSADPALMFQVPLC